MYLNKAVCHIALSLGVFLTSSSPSVAQTAQSTPETVLATFRVKPDQLSAFLKLMPEYWAALRAQDLVLADPHLVLQGEEHGRPTVVEVFSWKDHDAPEHVPAQIQKYWDKINEMVETRDGHPGVEFPEMSIVK
jgi:quinol monooxygenase YgiN